MNAIKPYLFWIVCGGILLVLLVLAVVLDPAYKGKNAEQATDYLSRTYREVEPLVGKAQRTVTSPPKEINPNRPQQIKQMEEEYLITDRWEGKLRTLQAEAETERRQVREELERRSEPLHQKVAETSEVSQWYFRYEDASRDLLIEMAKAGLLDGVDVESVDSEAFRTRAATDSGFRRRFGIFTKGVDWPAESMHFELTRKLRILQALADLAADAKGDVQLNPWMEEFVPAPQDGASIVLSGISWETGDPQLGSGPVSIVDGQAVPVEVNVRGPAAAILDFSVGIESSPMPLFALVGFAINPLPRAPAGDEPDAPMTAELLVCALDFKAGQ